MNGLKWYYDSDWIKIILKTFINFKKGLELS